MDSALNSTVLMRLLSNQALIMDTLQQLAASNTMIDLAKRIDTCKQLAEAKDQTNDLHRQMFDEAMRSL